MYKPHPTWYHVTDIMWWGLKTLSAERIAWVNFFPGTFLERKRLCLSQLGQVLSPGISLGISPGVFLGIYIWKQSNSLTKTQNWVSMFINSMFIKQHLRIMNYPVSKWPKTITALSLSCTAPCQIVTISYYIPATTSYYYWPLIHVHSIESHNIIHEFKQEL